MSDKPQQIQLSRQQQALYEALSQLSGQQRALYKALSEKEQSLADMYLGSLMTLQQTGNPDLLALAAHGLRELMEKLPRYLDAPVDTNSPSLKGKVQELAQSWSNTLGRSQCYSDPNWSGNIDRPLLIFLRKAYQFFEWFKAERPTRRQQTANALRELDQLGQSLPAPIEGLRIKE